MNEGGCLNGNLFCVLFTALPVDNRNCEPTPFCPKKSNNIGQNKMLLTHLFVLSEIK